MHVKLLLDENMSASAAARLATEDGIDACHVRDRGLLGSDDHAVLERAYVEDRIVVTANVDDFVRLARSRELHAGVILIEHAAMQRGEQLAVIRAAVKLIEGQDMVNRVLWVDIDGTMELDDIPPP